MLLVAIFGSEGSGGGDGDQKGDGTTEKGGDSAGGDGDQNQAEVTPGDSEVLSNKGIPSDVQTMTPAISGEDSGIGSKNKSENGPWFQSAWNGDTLFFHLVFKTNTATHEKKVSIKGESDDDVFKQLQEAKAKKRNLNVIGLSYDKTIANGGFPYQIEISGFDQGTLTLVWEEDGLPTVKGL